MKLKRARQKTSKGLDINEKQVQFPQGARSPRFKAQLVKTCVIPHESINIDKEKIMERITFEEKEIRIIADTLNHYVPKKQRPDWKIFLEQLKEKIRKASD